MPRRKSAVHEHYRPTGDQGDRKIQLVQCIHCTHTCAGNNAARLLKHLQSGCWPASSQDDPRLQLSVVRSRQQASTQEQSYDGTSTTQGDAHLDRTGVPTSTQAAAPPVPTTKPSSLARQAGTVNANLFAQTSSVTTHYLLQVTIKDTKDPVVQRTLAIPNTFNFRHLDRCLATAFGYRGTKGMFDITTPAWNPGRGRPPRRKQIFIYNDEEQRSKWHRWDEEIEDTTPDERLVDQVSFRGLLEELQSLKIVYLVGTWAHDVDLVGSTVLSKTSANLSDGQAVCLAGEGHAVLGSSDAMMWQAFKDAYRTNTPTAQQKAYRIFYEQEATNGDPRGLGVGGPWRWDKENVNRELRLLPPASSPATPPPPPSVMPDTPLQDRGNGRVAGQDASSMTTHPHHVEFDPSAAGPNGFTPQSNRTAHQQESLHQQHQEPQPHQWQHQTSHSYTSQPAQAHTGYVPAEASGLHQLRYG